ncbi:hypothetical protein D3C85_920260 [compost metagenome]
MQLGLVARVLAADQLGGRHRLALADLGADLRLGQQHAVGLVLDDAVIGLAGIAVIAVAVLQDQVAAAIRLDMLAPLLGHQHADTAVLAILARDSPLGNEHVAQLAAIGGEGLGIGHPVTPLHGLEATRHQGVELGQGILLIEDARHLGHTLGRQTQAQPGHGQRDQQGRRQAVGHQPLLAHAGGGEHGHFAFEVEPAVCQQETEEQPKGQDQLEKTGNPEAHDHEQHAGVEDPLRGLGQVLDETAAHDDHQQHGADRTEGDQNLAGEITEDNQNQTLQGCQARAATLKLAALWPARRDDGPLKK